MKNIKIIKPKDSNVGVIHSIMTSLKDNTIDVDDESLLSILYNIENSKNNDQLFSINVDDDLTLLLGTLTNELFILVFYKNKWTEYYLFDNNYDEVFLVEYFNPYKKYQSSLNTIKSIIDPTKEYNKKYNLYELLNLALENRESMSIIHLNKDNFRKCHLELYFQRYNIINKEK